MSSGDVIAQFAVEKKSIADFSLLRTSRFFIFGTVAVVSCLYIWGFSYVFYLLMRHKLMTVCSLF